MTFHILLVVMQKYKSFDSIDMSKILSFPFFPATAWTAASSIKIETPAGSEPS